MRKSKASVKTRQDRHRADDLLTVTSYLVITKYERYSGNSPSGLYFNKIMSLIDAKLKGVANIRLPHCWYRYGDEVVRAAMPYNIKWTHQHEDKTIVSWRNESPSIDDSPQVQMISDLIDELTVKYADNVFDAVHEVYSYAPFDFQREYLNVREIFYGMKEAFNWDANTYLSLSAPQIYRAIDSFPSDDFPQLEKQRQITKELIQIVFDKTVQTIDMCHPFAISV